MTNQLRNLAGILCACALIATGAAPAEAQSKLQEVLQRGKLIVGTGSTNPPWHFKDEKGELVGYDIDMAKVIAKGLFNDEKKIEFVIQASDARIPNITTGKVDITCQFMTVTAGRAQQVAFTIPYYREGVSLLLLKNGKYADYDALKAAGDKVTVSVLQNVYAETMVHKALPAAKVDQYDSVDLIYQALNSNRADTAATDASSLRWFIKQNPDRYKDAGFGWEPQTYSCAVRQGDPDWLNFVNIAFREALTGVEFDTFKASFEKWFGETPPAPKIGFPTELR
jgi:polar amino acid transport system substrate-binding protein